MVTKYEDARNGKYKSDKPNDNIILNYIFCCRVQQKTAFYSNDCQAEVYEIVNLDSIKTNAIAFDNMPIEVNGYFYMNIENTYLYNNGNENRIWLEFNFFKPLKDSNNNTLNGRRLLSFKGKKIKVKGIYKFDKRGHLGIYDGGITDITFFVIE